MRGNSAYLVIDDILQADPFLLVQVVEELLIEYESDAADLFHSTLCLRMSVDEIRSDGDGQLPAKLLPLESLEGVSFSVSSFKRGKSRRAKKKPPLIVRKFHIYNIDIFRGKLILRTKMHFKGNINSKQRVREDVYFPVNAKNNNGCCGTICSSLPL